MLKDVPDIEGTQVDIASVIDAKGLRQRLQRTGICISNPPYSNSAKEAGDLTPEARREISARKKQLRELVAKNDPDLKNILNPNSVSPWFSVLMEELVDPENGIIAKIMPTTACTSIDGVVERKFWAERFDIAIIVTSHDPHNPNWSAETAVTESMMVARRRNGKRKPTRFISLARKPQNAEEVQKLHQRIIERNLEAWGQECEWSQERMAEGDWSPAVWFNLGLGEAARTLEEWANKDGWARIGDIWEVKTTKQIVGQEKWEWCEEHEAEVAVIKGAGMDAQTRIAGVIDGRARRVKELRDKETVLQNLVGKASYLLITNTQDCSSARLNSIAVEERVVGYTWTPVQNISREEAEAIAVWNNSTLGRVGMRKWGSRKITWPMYQPKAISKMVVPDIRDRKGEAVKQKLRDAFASTKDDEVASYRDGIVGVREIWDDAVSEATGLDRKWIRDCAKLLANEPTIKG